jgi:hypothetical protein
MAIIQLLKPPLRAAFHWRAIARWLPSPDRSSVAVFLDRVSRHQYSALLELPIEQLVAQIQAAAETALAVPWLDTFFLASLIGDRGVDIDGIRDAKQGDDRAMAAARERAVTSSLIQRRLDALQIQVKRDWGRLLRVLSLTVSLIVTAMAANVFGLWRQNVVGTAFLVLLLSALGGFFASVARDAVATVERLRN